MAAITVSSIPTEDMPPIGVIEADDTFTAVLPLDDMVLFVAVEQPLRSLLIVSLRQLADECEASEAALAGGQL